MNSSNSACWPAWSIRSTRWRRPSADSPNATWRGPSTCTAMALVQHYPLGRDCSRCRMAGRPPSATNTGGRQRRAGGDRRPVPPVGGGDCDHRRGGGPAGGPGPAGPRRRPGRVTGAGPARRAARFRLRLPRHCWGWRTRCARAVPGRVAECHAAGIRVVMITGDYPGTAASIARAGRASTAGGERPHRPRDRRRSTMRSSRRAIGAANVFARVRARAEAAPGAGAARPTARWWR